MKTLEQKKLILASLLTAMTCVATLAIRVPSPTDGFVNCGDVVVLLCGLILGPLWGAAAAGTGSFLADIIAGYPIYAPATLIIKGLMAAVIALVCLFLSKWIKTSFVTQIIGGIIAEGLMVGLYFLYEATVIGYGMAAVLSIPGNIVQGVFGISVGVFLYQILYRVAPKMIISGSNKHE